MKPRNFPVRKLRRQLGARLRADPAFAPTTKQAELLLTPKDNSFKPGKLAWRVYG